MKKMITLLSAGLCILNASYSQKTKCVEEHTIGITYYDVQTTRAMQNRMYYFTDGTIGAVFNMIPDQQGPLNHEIGYNYFDGNVWGAFPVQSITSGESTNPSYTNFGENGEIAVSEGNNGLYINYRTEKGTGPWQEMLFQGPVGYEKLYSPQVVTSGPDDLVIHLFAICKDTTVQLGYQDNIGKIFYSRTTDGGITWDPLHLEFDFQDDYFGFSEMAIKATEPSDGTLAFVAGDYFTDLVLMKSTDEGDTWEKTILVEHPYPFMELGTTVTDTFWTHNGSMDVAIDLQGKANVVFSLCRIAADASGYIYPDTLSDGIVYWKEGMDVFSNNINALNPYGHPDSELIEDFNLIGWVQDLDGNGEIDLLWDYPWYPQLGISIMPSISIFDQGYVFVAWSALTEYFTFGSNDLRHLWCRYGHDGNWGEFVDLTDDLIHIFDECVFPAAAPRINDDHLHLIYQMDNDPGLNNTGSPPFPENNINYLKVPIGFIPVYFAMADFGADATLIDEGNEIHFTNLSTGYPIEWLTYEWEFEGGNPATSAETHPVVTYDSAGIFKVKLTASVTPNIYDILTKDNYITVLPGMGRAEVSGASAVRVFPNPTSGKLNIHLPEVGRFAFQITDIIGKRIRSGTSLGASCTLTIDLADQEDGLYFIMVTDETFSYTQKFILKRF